MTQTAQTREALVEVIARAMCASEGFNPESGRASDGSPLWRQWIPQSKAALLALEAAGARLAPVEATEQMNIAAVDAYRATNMVPSIWTAALSASPYAKDTP